MNRLLTITLVIGALGAVGAYVVFRDRGVPSPQTIKEMEALVVMPPGAQPFTDYTRYYAYGWKGWTPVVVGVFLWNAPLGHEPNDATPVPGVPRAYTASEPPVIFDGGCYVVTVYYDESAKRFLLTEHDGKQQLAVCNGVA